MSELVIVGGGFAGTWAALAAARQIHDHDDAIRVSLVSTDPYLTIRPRLYEADPQSLRVPLGPTLAPVGVTLVEGLVEGIDVEAQTVTVDAGRAGGRPLAYDRLILAAGSTQRPLPLPHAGQRTWNIDTHAAAVALDAHLQHVVRNLEVAGNDTIAIVGAGFTGIELATEMRSRLARHADRELADTLRLVLIEQADVVGPDLGANPRPDIEQALRQHNVEIRKGTRVVELRDRALSLSDGSRIATATTIVTAGLQANRLADQLDVGTDELGRVPVDATLHAVGVPGVFAAGDVARAFVDDEHLALMSCQHAMRMGLFAGFNAARELLGLSLQPYRQPDYVTCLDLGNAGAVFTRGWERQVLYRGDEAKKKKRAINTRWIYPPVGDRASILDRGDIDVKSRH